MAAKKNNVIVTCREVGFGDDLNDANSDITL